MLNDLQKQKQQSFSSSLVSASKNNFDAVGFIVLAKCVSGYPHFLPFPLSTLHSPTHPQLYFILCGFCDKLKLSLHPLYPLPLSTPCALLHVPGKIHFFVLYGFYDFSISFATSRSTRELYQFASARDLPINFKDDVAMRIRYAALYVHCHSNRDSDINYFNCHMSFTLPEFELNGGNLRCFCNEVKLVF